MTDFDRVLALLVRLETRLVRLMAVHDLTPEGNHVHTPCKTAAKTDAIGDGCITASRHGKGVADDLGKAGGNRCSTGVLHCANQTVEKICSRERAGEHS